MTDNERLAVLETDFKHMSREMDKMARQVDEMHALLTQAKGARWAIVGIASFAGFLAGLSNMLFHR